MHGKVAIVTGGCGGIGFAVVKKLGINGCKIAILSSHEHDDKIYELEQLGIEVLFVKGSVDNGEVRKFLVEQTVETFGRIDILVNCAGVAPIERKDILEMTEESYDRVMGINTKGTLFLTQLVARQMLEQEKIFDKSGSIVNIGSCSAEVSSISRGEYCISKAGVSMITTLFADRLAANGITVNEVRPGVIKTGMTETVNEKYDKLIQNGIFPIPRWGEPEDVANVVAFLCSDGLSYTTGDYINVDGGFHIKRL